MIEYVKLNTLKATMGILLGIGMIFSLNSVSAATLSLGNDDVQKAPSVFKVNKVPKDETTEGSAKKPEKVSKDSKKVKEPEVEEDIIDSFVVLKGARRYHLAECKLVTRSKGTKSTVNGAGAISGKYFSCGVCSPKAYKDPPKKKEAEKPKPEAGAKNAKSGKAAKTTKATPKSEAAPKTNKRR